MNDARKITLKDFIDLLYIPDGFKAAYNKLVLFTSEKYKICSTNASSIGVNPYLDVNVLYFKACNNLGTIFFEVYLDINSQELE